MGRTIGVLLALIAAACASSGETPEPASAPTESATSGDSEAATSIDAEPVAAEPMAAESGPPTAPEPVAVTITIRLGTEEADLPFELTTLAGESVATGRSGENLTLPEGAYIARVAIERPAQLIDTPTYEEEVLIGAGDDEVRVTIPVSRVRLVLRRRGRTLRSAQVRLVRQGSEEEVARFRSSDDFIPISPGRYEAVVETGTGEFRVRGLMFMEGAQQTVPVDVD